MRWLLILWTAAVLSGCAQLLWKDMTTGHRSGTRAEADYKACSAEAGTATQGRNATYDETAAYRKQLLTCMYSHGWRPANLQRL